MFRQPKHSWASALERENDPMWSKARTPGRDTQSLPSHPRVHPDSFLPFTRRQAAHAELKGQLLLSEHSTSHEGRRPVLGRDTEQRVQPGPNMPKSKGERMPSPTTHSPSNTTRRMLG